MDAPCGLQELSGLLGFTVKVPWRGDFLDRVIPGC